MRTLEQAERDYDRALADGAAAVSVMDEKLKQQRQDSLRMLAAVVLSCGGTVEVTSRALIDVYDVEVVIADNPQSGGITVTARTK